MTATMPEAVTFSDPMTMVSIDDYPLGGFKRGKCLFWIEHNPKHGHRVCRKTTGKAKTGTFSGKTVFVTGSDGKTYWLSIGLHSESISVHRYDFMSAKVVQTREGWLENYITPDDGEVYAELLALIESQYK